MGERKNTLRMAHINKANYISNAVLNDLKILFNFEMDSKDRAAILLVGLPLLNSTLQLGVHEPLRQKIIMNYNSILSTWERNNSSSKLPASSPLR